VAVPLTTNVTPKEAQKELQYNSLSTEIQRMWNVKCIIVLGRVVTEVIEKYMEVILGNNPIYSVQNTAVL
jgi:hypothetical protein